MTVIFYHTGEGKGNENDCRSRCREKRQSGAGNKNDPHTVIPLSIFIIKRRLYMGSTDSSGLSRQVQHKATGNTADFNTIKVACYLSTSIPDVSQNTKEPYHADSLQMANWCVSRCFKNAQNKAESKIRNFVPFHSHQSQCLLTLFLISLKFVYGVRHIPVCISPNILCPVFFPTIRVLFFQNPS